MTKINNNIKKIVSYCLEIVVVITFVLPLYMLVTSAFKYEVDIFDPSRLLVFQITLGNFERVIYHYGFLNALKNSLIVTIGTVGLTLFLSLLTAFALSRYRFRGRESLSLDILTFRMLPPVVTAIPLFALAWLLGLYNTYWILILANTVVNLPLSIWLLKSFIDDIPISYEEAAIIDGCNRFEVLRYVTIPLLLHGLIATIALVFIFVWNEFFFALIFTGADKRTLSVAIAMTMSERRIYWGESCAMGLLVLLPVLIMFIFIEKYLARALTFGQMGK